MAAVDLREALRYLRASPEDEFTQRLVRETAETLESSLHPRWLYRLFDVKPEPEGVALGETGLVLPGRLATGMLQECRRAAVLVCTLGVAFDRLLRAAEVRDMARAVVLDACGSSYVESGCLDAEAEIAAQSPERYRTDRFSPGYGDLPLELQDGLITLTGADKVLGVYANASHLLTPSKTVTAVVGLSDRPQGARIRGCGCCTLTENCAYRKGGKTCAI
ncbi:MAG: methionine synthase [Oscillospiraceae bacterium]|nr:methionine synthase [Oscillospiraceae bacterium]